MPTAQPGRRFGGRAKGVPNKFTRQLKELILEALHDAGGVAYLTRQAEANPVAFMALLGRVLPLQVAGHDGGPMTIVVDTGVPRHGDATGPLLPAG